MMKYPRMPSAVIIVMSVILYACGTTAAGPQAWVDTPLDNTTVPLAPLTLMAHASDSNGVASIEFYANDQLLVSAGAGGARLGRAQYEWTPPGPGTYMIGARGISNGGTTGALATSLVTISGNVTLTPTEEQSVGPPSTITVTITITATVTNTPVTPPPPPASPSVVANKDANCREGPGTAYEVYGSLLKGEEAVIKGRLQDNSWFLIALAGSSSNCWISAITVDVRGDPDSVQVVVAPPPPQQAPPPQQNPPPVDVLPPAPIDTTPPAIYGSATDKSTMCASSQVTSNVVAVDDSGISQVYASWTITNNNGAVVESGSVNYVTIPSINGAYTGVFGSFNYPGTLNIYGTVVDKAGNTASFSHVVTINCS
ncbi:MAG: Ig-like domain-containing protein [Anaerolineales bacterium]|nr:Ig-like domain-containing protein [Anaerolineales bacterium]